MSMSRKDFERLADGLADCRPTDNQSREFVTWAQACLAASSVCVAASERFDSGRFRHACMTRPNHGSAGSASAAARIAS